MTAVRYRTKEAKQMVGRIRAACPDAVIESTERGHLKVTGPAGTAILPSKRLNPSETRIQLARHAGIRLAA